MTNTMTSVKLVVGILLLAVVVEGRWPCKKAAEKLDNCRDNGYVIGDCAVGEGSLSEKQRRRCDDLKTKYKERCSDAYECDLKETEDGSAAEDTEGWTAVEPTKEIPFDLESTPLQIKTNSNDGSEEVVSLHLHTSEGEDAGDIYFDFYDPPDYKIRYCNRNFLPLPVSPPSEVNKVWTIKKLLPGPRIIVECNGETVLDFTMSGDTCDDSAWSTIWNRDVAKMEFGDEFGAMDSASDEWRPAPPGDVQSAGWTAVEKGEKIPIDLQSTALEIKTDHTVGSGELVDYVSVFFQTAEDDGAGGLYFDFNSPPQYTIYQCLRTYVNLPVLPTEAIKVWTVSKLPGPRLTIQCNGVTVVDLTFSEDTCEDSSWSSTWNSDVAKIYFSNWNNDAPVDYRFALPGTPE